MSHRPFEPNPETLAASDTYCVFVEEVEHHVGKAGVTPMSMDNQQFLQVTESGQRKVAGHHCLGRERMSLLGDPSFGLTSVSSPQTQGKARMEKPSSEHSVRVTAKTCLALVHLLLPSIEQKFSLRSTRVQGSHFIGLI